MFTLSAWRREGASQTPMIALIGPAGPSQYFVFTLDELRAACLHGAPVVDGYHSLQIWGELFLFVDTPAIPKPGTGNLTCAYHAVHFPFRAREELVAIAEDAIDAYDRAAPTRWGSKDRISVDLSPDWDEWSTRYGQGKGSVKLVAAPECIGRLGRDMHLDPSGECERCYDHVVQIARNSTYSVDDVAEVRFSIDWDGYFWSVPGLVGGLINHGRNGSPDWSLHT